MNQHFTGKGSKVTKKYPPIDGEIIDKCHGYFSNNIEQKHTNKYIKTHKKAREGRCNKKQF